MAQAATRGARARRQATGTGLAPGRGGTPGRRWAPLGARQGPAGGAIRRASTSPLVSRSAVGSAVVVEIGRTIRGLHGRAATSFGERLLRYFRGCHTVVKMVCWNMRHLTESWRCLRDMDVDVALVQEACNPPTDVVCHVDTDSREHWDPTAWNSDWWVGRWPKLTDRHTMIVKRSDRAEVAWFKQVGPVSEVNQDEIAVSGISTIAAARVSPPGMEPFIAVSMYARWIAPHPTTKTKFKVGYSDGTAHRIISDLSAFIGNADPSTHRIIAGGDLNLIYGSNTCDPQALDERGSGVFERFETIGLERMGPQYPAGRKAASIPSYLPADTKNVPTYYTMSERPETAVRQLDYVFASRGFHERVRVRALNEVDEWGPSDHCRILIEVD